MRKMNFGLELPARLCQLSALLLLDLPALAKLCVQPEPALHVCPGTFQLLSVAQIFCYKYARGG